jgi:hypothetical protein
MGSTGDYESGLTYYNMECDRQRIYIDEYIRRIRFYGLEGARVQERLNDMVFEYAKASRRRYWFRIAFDALTRICKPTRDNILKIFEFI